MQYCVHGENAEWLHHPEKDHDMPGTLTGLFKGLLKDVDLCPENVFHLLFPPTQPSLICSLLVGSIKTQFDIYILSNKADTRPEHRNVRLRGVLSGSGGRWRFQGSGTDAALLAFFELPFPLQTHGLQKIKLSFHLSCWNLSSWRQFFFFFNQNNRCAICEKYENPVSARLDTSQLICLATAAGAAYLQRNYAAVVTTSRLFPGGRDAA